MFDLSPEIVAKFTLELEYRTTYPLSSQNRTKYPLNISKRFFWGGFADVVVGFTCQVISFYVI